MKYLFLLGFLVAGCKQGKGERCQINDDCTTGLVCNQATNTCQETTGGGIDATVPDGPKNDAALDGGVDAAGTHGPHCSNNIQDVNETDVDCGGSCGPCANTKMCLVAKDCMSMNCTAGHLCAP